MKRSIVVGGFPGATFARLSSLALSLGLTWFGGQALAQISSTGAQETGTRVEVTARDLDAARSVISRGIHTAGTARLSGVRNAPKTFKSDQTGALVEIGSNDHVGARTGTIGTIGSTVPSFTGPGFYPDDLVQNNPPGPVVTNARVLNVFINCNGGCFVSPGQSSTPGSFLVHFFASNFVHVLDQYTGSTQSGRYRWAGASQVQYPIQGAQLNDATDIAAILHGVAASFGTGYNVIYNVFVPQGIDVCITTTAGLQCFSPNNPANWVFCAYHSYVDFPDIGHVLYTVIPYPDQPLVSGGVPAYVCDVGQPNPNVDTAPTPNGVVADSVASFLDHELSETITDPDINAYQVQNSLADYLSEIGDICVNPGFLYTPFALSGSLYYIQPEYSNTYHACVTVP
jgi:hypothetical protein